jgi:hypothetical protein
MKYCQATTMNHQVAQKYTSCITDINALTLKEGYTGVSPLFTNAEVVINLDEAESLFSVSIGRKEKNKSMDMAFGISNSTRNQMLMVELKFNVTEFYSLKKTDLEGKVAGSSLMLSNIPSIYKRYIFIFKTEHLQEAINRLFRMVPKIDSNYIALDVHLLKETYF